MDLRVIARTTLANLIRFGSGLAMLVATPALLGRLGVSEYAVWVLVIQMTAYVALLELGIADAMVRFVAPFANQARVCREAAGVMRAGLLVETVFAAAGAVLAVVVALLVPTVLHQIPASLVGVAQFGFLVIGLAGSAHLLTAPLSGYFNAVQRNLGPAVAVFVVRVATVGVVVVVSAQGLRPAILAMSAGLLTNLAVQAVLFRRDFVEFRLRGPADRVLARAILSHCSTMMIWSAAGLMVSGLDTTIVGAFDFASVGPYAIAVSVTALVFGVHAALLAAFVPDVAREHAAGVPQAVVRTIMVAARYGNVFLCLACGAVAAHGRWALRLWLGSETAKSVYPLFLTLTIAKTAGAIMSPYVIGLIGTGDHRRVRVTPLIEGGVNLAASVLLVREFGAIGAAFGTLIGCVVGTVLHGFYNIPRTTSFRLPRGRYFASTVAGAAGCALPLVAVAVIPHSSTSLHWLLLGLATLLSMSLAVLLVRRTPASEVSA